MHEKTPEDDENDDEDDDEENDDENDVEEDAMKQRCERIPHSEVGRRNYEYVNAWEICEEWGNGDVRWRGKRRTHLGTMWVDHVVWKEVDQNFKG